ncbi:hypothetical protein P43SY_002623 [Pythium insidiosum]|uniref:Uncharacterized protein n=1 Tax=Pythium insidiosum TaxID=114742 RepID=A0AAD5QB82_PYTIN|nr:hypothetical protein P43SY_002623 [Pythium insidiosum]
MAFRREVPALETLVLKFISKSGRLLDKIVSEQTVERTHRISKPSKSRTHKVKQELLRALLQSGRFTDDTLPDSFFHASMTRLEITGARISTKFIARLTKVCTKLHTINFSGCFRLTDDAIEVLLTNCPEIKELNLENCRKLSDITLDHLRKLAPKLQAIVTTVNAKMEILPDAETPVKQLTETVSDPSGSTGGQDETQQGDEAKEPERKRLKKIDFRYTTVPKEIAASIRERYPDLHVTY